jgi:hypothetical protein|tara:strand:+ start:42 stop:401 length:360 start_codon:yes stop_codon:yes gene_type:complete
MMEELHRLDLEQGEALTKLYVRLGNELAMSDECLKQVALEESKRDQLLIGVWNLPEGSTKESLLEKSGTLIASLKENRVKVLLTLKSSVWNTSNTLKKLHEKRNTIRAEALLQEEITED